MPRIGSITQAPGRLGALARMGSNVVPACGHGVVLRSGDGAQAYPPGLRLGSVSTQDLFLGQFAANRVVFQTPMFKGRFAISGVTRDALGTPIAGCTVSLFRGDAFNTFIQTLISDGSGAYTFSLGDNSGIFWLRAYLAGAPDLAGTTVNTLVAV